MRVFIILFAFLIVSPAMFSPVSGFEVEQLLFSSRDPTALVSPTISGYDFVFTQGSDDYPLMGLACSNTPYPYISTLPLGGQLSYDERMLRVNNTRDIPITQGLGSDAQTDSRIFLTNNDIWAAFRADARNEGERTRFGGETEYSWPGGATFQGPTVVWGLPQSMNQGGATITQQFPMIRTDFRVMSGDDIFFGDDAITTWMRLYNGGRDMLNAQGDVHENKNDFRGFLWQVRGGVSGGNDYFERLTDPGREQYGNYTAYKDGKYYFKITTGDNEKYSGPEVLDSYAYMLQWTAFYGGNRYQQGPNGYLDWEPNIFVLNTGFPDAILQRTNNMQLIDSFWLDEEGETYRAPEIKKGDMIVTMRTSNVEELAAGLRQHSEKATFGHMIPLLARDSSNMTVTGAAQSLFFNSYALVDPAEAGVPLLRHDNATSEFAGKIVGYHVRPVYDVFGDSVEPKADDTMYVPGYDFSNNVEVTCRPFVWGGGEIASPEIIQYGDPIVVEPDFDCSETYHLPNVPWAHEWGLTFSDVVPDDYCTVRPDNQKIPLPPTVIPGAVPVYRDILMLVPDYSHDTSNATARVDLKILPEASPYTFSIEDYTTCGAYDSVSGELGSFMTTDNKTAGLFTDFLGSTIPYVWFARDNPLIVSCNNLVFHGGAEPAVNVTFSKTLNADIPYYQKFIAAIRADDWGWGVGESEITDQPGFAPYQNLIFGMPFVAVMGMLTAMIGFNRRHIPAAGISYGIVLGALTYFGLIDIPVAAFGAIVTFTIILIFSKGFR